MCRTLLLFFLFSLSTVLKAQPDSLTIHITYEVPILDSEFPKRKYYTGADYDKYDKNKYNLFMQYVYEPAMKNNQLSEGNKKLLEDLKKYLLCSDRDAGKCGVDHLPIWPVYQFKYHEKDTVYQSYVSVFTRFPFYDEKYYEDTKDTILHHGLMQKKMHVVYSNYNKTAIYSIKKYKRFGAVCEAMRTFILHKSDTTDFRVPAFCTPYELDLVYRSDSVMNKVLVDYNDWDNSGSYCDASQEQVSFAQLKNVPFLYFTTDVDPNGWFTYYPTRGIYLKLSNTMIVRLFDFRVEMVECSCI